ncbi:hypothetical protein MAR_023517, partial [Mya arenaria]
MFDSPWLCDFGAQMNQCLKDYRVNVKTEHVYHNSYDIPDDDLCTVFQKLRTCLFVEPSGDCQQNHSNFLNNIFRQRFSPSQCITLEQTTTKISKAHSHSYS